MRKALSYSLLLLLAAVASCSKALEIDLEPLDDALSQRNEYKENFEYAIHKLRSERPKNQLDLYEYNSAMAFAFQQHSYDSSLAYHSKNILLAQKLKNDDLLNEARINIARLHVGAGYYQEANDMLALLPDSLNSNLSVRKDYAYLMLYREMRNYAPNEESRTRYTERFRNGCLDIVERLQPNSWDEKYIKWEIARNADNKKAAIECAKELHSVSTLGTKGYTNACYYQYLSFLSAGNFSEAYSSLVEAAVNDVEAYFTDHISLDCIIDILYEKYQAESREDCLNKAISYAINYNLPDAITYNGRLRPWTQSTTLLRLEKAHMALSKKHDAQKSRNILFLCAAMTLLVIIVIVLLIVRKDLVNSRNELRAANKTKEKYIKQFLCMLSQDRLQFTHYRNKVSIYIRRGKSEQLLQEIEKSNRNAEDLLSFYKVFDAAFLELYPGFVERVNSLLRLGEEIVPENENSLTSELRVYALVMLGISNSKEISEILGYSLNTVYNLKASMRNKYIGKREEFDAAICNGV